MMVSPAIGLQPPNSYPPVFFAKNYPPTFVGFFHAKRVFCQKTIHHIHPSIHDCAKLVGYDFRRLSRRQPAAAAAAPPIAGCPTRRVLLPVRRWCAALTVER